MSMLNKAKSKAQSFIDKPFFLSPKIRFNKLRSLSINELNNESGFTLVELIVVVMMIGILSSIAIPQFMSSADKAKQKEASGIVAALIKAATAYNTEYGSLPLNAEDVSEYAKFQQCDDGDAEARGGAVCKAIDPTPVTGDSTQFITSSGNYDIEFDATEENPDNGGTMFRVKANPNGDGYRNNGSAVIGCYNPTSSITLVYEYTAKTRTETEGRGPDRDYKNC